MQTFLRVHHAIIPRGVGMCDEPLRTFAWEAIYNNNANK